MRSLDAWRESDAWLAERLLRGGVAPRHVRRSLRELQDHRCDLAAALQQGGWGEADAASEVRRVVGEPDLLASQILARPELRSRARRFHWLVFGIAPPLFCTVLSLGIGMAAMDLARIDLVFARLLALWLVPVVLCCFVIAAAVQRRMPPWWPVTGIVLMILVSGATGFSPGWIYIGPSVAPTRTPILMSGLLLLYVIAQRSRRVPCAE